VIFPRGPPAHEGAGKVSHPKFVDSARESTGLWTVISHQSLFMTGRSFKVRRRKRKLRLLVVVEKVIELSTNRPPRAVASWTARLSLESPAHVAQYAARVSEAEEFSTLGACAQCELLGIASHCIDFPECTHQNRSFGCIVELAGCDSGGTSRHTLRSH
jgi:hypothetical protein